MTELPSQRHLLDAIAVLDRLKIPYMVMGGFAVRFWAVPRMTYDADLAVSAGEEALQRLLRSLKEAGFDLPSEHAAGFTDKVGEMEKVKVTRFAEATVWETDLFLARGPLLESAMARRRKQSLEGREIHVMAPEDVILLKLIAHRRKDLADVEDILRLAEGLDVAYLRSWARRLGLTKRLDAFLP